MDKPEIGNKVAEAGIDSRNKTSDGGRKNFARLPERAPQVCQLLPSVKIWRAGRNLNFNFFESKNSARLHVSPKSASRSRSSVENRVRWNLLLEQKEQAFCKLILPITDRAVYVQEDIQKLERFQFVSAAVFPITVAFVVSSVGFSSEFFGMFRIFLIGLILSTIMIT